MTVPDRGSDTELSFIRHSVRYLLDAYYDWRERRRTKTWEGEDETGNAWN